MEPDTDGAVVFSELPAGSVLNSSKLTFNGMSISCPLVSSTIHVKVTSDSIGRMGLGRLLDSVVEIGTGTGSENYTKINLAGPYHHHTKIIVVCLSVSNGGSPETI